MLILKTRICDESKILTVIPNNKISWMKEILFMLITKRFYFSILSEVQI
jgi:hypothetical protein